MNKAVQDIGWDDCSEPAFRGHKSSFDVDGTEEIVELIETLFVKNVSPGRQWDSRAEPNLPRVKSTYIVCDILKSSSCMMNEKTSSE